MERFSWLRFLTFATHLENEKSYGFDVLSVDYIYYNSPQPIKRPYSSGVERCTCNAKADSSNLSGGMPL